MKEILVVRHANWNLADDTLTEEGRAQCRARKHALGEFALAYSSPTGRAKETAALLSSKEPTVDGRVAIVQASPELSAKVLELRKTHPFGIAGAIISVPELRGPLQKQGEAFKGLLAEVFSALQDGRRALVVSHDGVMVGLEKVLNGSPFDQIDHTYGELEGFSVNENFELTRLP